MTMALYPDGSMAIERPIIFSTTIPSILDGRKTMTRRVIKGDPVEVDGRLYVRGGMPVDAIKCPYGVPGDRLWVRETMTYSLIRQNYYYCDKGVGNEIYNRLRAKHLAAKQGGCKTVPSIFMPRWASRILLEVVSVRVERVQDISCADATAEGISPKSHECGCDACRMSGRYCPATQSSIIMEFRELWDSINAKRGFGWDVNPFVWVLTFKVI